MSSTIRTQQRHCQNEVVSHVFLRHLQDIADQHVNNVVHDCIGKGLLSLTVVPKGSGVGVTVSNLHGYSGGGHFKQTGSEDVDLSALLPTTGGRYVSVFAVPSWHDFDYRPNGVNVSDYHQRTESFTLVAEAGGANVPTAPSASAVRVCSIWVTSSTTEITLGMIKTSVGFADRMVPNSGKLDKAGGVVSGPIYYNTVAGSAGGRPMVFSNSGVNNLTELGSYEGANPDWQNVHYVTTNWINSFMPNNNLKISLDFDMGFLNWNTGAVETSCIQPLQVRFSTDFSGNDVTATGGIVIIYERNEANNKTGKFLVVVFGSTIFVNRFANSQFRWLATSAPSQSSL